jgi:hypothetical protein
MGRANWYYNHPLACTCVYCVRKRLKSQYVADQKPPPEISKNKDKQQSATKLATRKSAKSKNLKHLHWLWAIIPLCIITTVIVLLTRPPQLVISEPSVSEITAASATVMCNTNTDCYCILNVKLPNQVWATFSEEPESTGTRHIFKLSGLYGGNTYILKMYASNKKPVIAQPGYFSAESDETSFKTKMANPVISELEISDKYVSWSTNIPTRFIIYDNGDSIAHSDEYSTSHSVELNLSPYFDHLLTVTVFDHSGLSSQSAPTPIVGRLTHRLIPVESHVSPCGLVELIDNPEAVDHTYGQLVAFLETDITDKRLYQQDVFTCGDYAEILHNNAEKAGWRAGFVVLEICPPQETSIYTPRLSSARQAEENTTPDMILHACNAFQTTDLGLVFIDNTGAFEEGNYPFSRGISVFTPGRADKVVKAKIGEEYCPESIFKRSATYYECMGIFSGYTIYWSPIEVTHLP